MLDRAVDAGERLAGQPEFRPFHRTFLAGTLRVIASDLDNLRLRKERNIEFHRLFRTTFEHQERGDLLSGHRRHSGFVSSTLSILHRRADAMAERGDEYPIN